MTTNPVSPSRTLALAPPPDKAELYAEQDAESIRLRLISEEKLAEFILAGFNLTVQQGVEGLFIFKLFDERHRSQGWQSGIYYPNNTGIFPKLTLELMRPSLRKLSGYEP